MILEFALPGRAHQTPESSRVSLNTLSKASMHERHALRTRVHRAGGWRERHDCSGVRYGYGSTKHRFLYCISIISDSE